MRKMVGATLAKRTVPIIDVVIVVFMKIVADINIFPAIVVEVSNSQT